MYVLDPTGWDELSSVGDLCICILDWTIIKLLVTYSIVTTRQTGVLPAPDRA